LTELHSSTRAVDALFKKEFQRRHNNTGAKKLDQDLGLIKFTFSGFMVTLPAVDCFAAQSGALHFGVRSFVETL
jgi:hypothetical protein